MPFPQYSSNMSLINPSDLNVMNTGMGGLYNSSIPGMNNELMGLAKGIPNQAATQAEAPGLSQMDMYKMAAGALQGMGRNQQPQQMPQLPILRDTNQFRFAGMQQNPQMLAQALRNR